MNSMEQFDVPEAGQESQRLADVKGTSLEDLRAMDYYERLGVDRDASQEEIGAAFKEIAAGLHPDQPGGASDDDVERLKLITEAKSGLRNDEARTEYGVENPAKTNDFIKNLRELGKRAAAEQEESDKRFRERYFEEIRQGKKKADEYFEEIRQGKRMP